MFALGGVAVLCDVFRGSGVGVGHFAGEFPEFNFHIFDVVEDGHAFVEDGAAGEGESVLGEVAGGEAFGEGEVAVVEVVHAANDFEEGGFAGAVASDKADVVGGGD